MPDADPFVFTAALLLATGVLPLVGTVALVIYRIRTKATKQTKDSGINVPLVAGQSAIKGLPWLIWAFNFWTPRLVLRADALEYRVFRLRRRAYAGIAQVDYLRSAIGTPNVIVDFPDSRWSFLAWVPERNAARDLIRRLQDKGCAISTRATTLLRT